MDEYKGPVKFWSELFPHILVILVCLYILTCVLVYSLRHPELTETQKLLNLIDVFLWR